MPRSFLVLSVTSILLALAGCDGSDGRVDASTGFDAGHSDAGPVADSGPGPTDGGMIADAGVDSGSAADAGSTDAGASTLDPSATGPRTVSTQSDTVSRAGRNTPVTAYVPDGAPGPLVVFAPGFQISASNYEGTLRHVASHGFVVIGADPPGSAIAPNHVAMRDDLVAVIDWAQGEFSPAPGVLVAGHSLGGKLATMVAGEDSRVTAMMGIDPVNGGSPFLGYTANLPDVVPAVTTTLRIPVAYLGETLDGAAGFGGMACAPSDQNFQTFYDGTDGAPAVYEHTFTGADHMDFLDTTAGCSVCGFCMDGTADTNAVSNSTRTLLAAFALRHLRGEAGLEGWLDGTRPLSGVTVRSR